VEKATITKSIRWHSTLCCRYHCVWVWNATLWRHITSWIERDHVIKSRVSASYDSGPASVATTASAVITRCHVYIRLCAGILHLLPLQSRT